MSISFNDISHTVLSTAAMAAVTVLSMNGKCDAVQALTVILAASGIGAAGIVASHATAAVASASGDATGPSGDVSVAADPAQLDA